MIRFTSDKRAEYVVVLRKGGLSKVGRDAAGGGAGTCFVCGCQTKEGIVLLHSFLCAACESDITASRVTDGDYDFFMQRVAAFWRTLAEETVSSEGSFPGGRGIMN